MRKVHRYRRTEKNSQILRKYRKPYRFYIEKNMQLFLEKDEKYREIYI